MFKFLLPLLVLSISYIEFLSASQPNIILIYADVTLNKPAIDDGNQERLFIRIEVADP